MSSARGRRALSRVLVYAIAIVICLFSLGPVIWGISTSFKPDSEIFQLPPRLIPHPATLRNYVQVVTDSSMIRYFINSAVVSVGSVIISLLIGVLAAYGFSRYRFPGAKTLLATILFTRVLPRVTVIVPFFITLRNLRLLNTYPGLILIYLVVVMPISVWLLKGFFDRLPYEIEEAAIVDGCSPLRLLASIILPLSGPAVAAVGMYTFILAWNEFLFALLVTTTKATRTISVGLAFFIDDAGVHWGQLMAASVLMSIPAVVIFTLSQGLLVKGLSEGAVKG